MCVSPSKGGVASVPLGPNKAGVTFLSIRLHLNIQDVVMSVTVNTYYPTLTVVHAMSM